MTKMKWDKQQRNTKAALLRDAALDLPHTWPAKFPGTCSHCSGHIRPNSPIRNAADGTYEHAICPKVRTTA
jgi:hypothetical protein